jgi:hypothetical protein
VPNRSDRRDEVGSAKVVHASAFRKEDDMLSLLKKLITDDGGQDLAEYGIALAVIGVAAGAAALAISTDVGALWTNAQTIIHAAL